MQKEGSHIPNYTQLHSHHIERSAIRCSTYKHYSRKADHVDDRLVEGYLLVKGGNPRPEIHDPLQLFEYVSQYWGNESSIDDTMDLAVVFSRLFGS